MSRKFKIWYILLRKIFGFLLLSVFTTWIFLYSFFESLNYNYYISLLLAVVLFFLSSNTLFELNSNILSFSKIKIGKIIFDKNDLFNFISVFIGTIATYFINHTLGLNAILASGMIGLFGYIFIKKYEIAIFCGSFIAMASSTLLDSIYVIIIASIIGGFILVISTDLFKGYGGKLGTIAFISCVITAYFFDIPILASDI